MSPFNFLRIIFWSFNEHKEVKFMFKREKSESKEKRIHREKKEKAITLTDIHAVVTKFAEQFMNCEAYYTKEELEVLNKAKELLEGVANESKAREYKDLTSDEDRRRRKAELERDLGIKGK